MKGNDKSFDISTTTTTKRGRGERFKKDQTKIRIQSRPSLIYTLPPELLIYIFVLSHTKDQKGIILARCLSHVSVLFRAIVLGSGCREIWGTISNYQTRREAVLFVDRFYAHGDRTSGASETSSKIEGGTSIGQTMTMIRNKGEKPFVTIILYEEAGCGISNVRKSETMISTLAELFIYDKFSLDHVLYAPSWKDVPENSSLYGTCFLIIVLQVMFHLVGAYRRAGVGSGKKVNLDSLNETELYEESGRVCGYGYRPRCGRRRLY